MKNNLVVMPSNDQNSEFFKVVNYPDNTPLWVREDFMNELAREVEKGNVTKILDESLRDQVFGEDYVDDLVNQIFIFKNKSKYDVLKLTGPKSYFRDDEIKQLESLKKDVRKLVITKNIKKTLIAGAVLSTLFFGSKAVISNAPEDSLLSDLSYKASVAVQDTFRSNDFYDLVLNELYKMDLNNNPHNNGEFFSKYSDIDFEEEFQISSFRNEVEVLKAEALSKSKVKDILDNNDIDLIMDKYGKLIVDGKQMFADNSLVADYVINNLSKEERIVLHEDYSVEDEVFNDLLNEKGLNLKSKGNVR